MAGRDSSGYGNYLQRSHKGLIRRLSISLHPYTVASRWPKKTLLNRAKVNKLTASPKQPMTDSEKKHFSGWITLIGAMLAYAGICGDVTYAFGVFLPPMSETFGWSRSSLSGPYTLFLIIGGVMGPVAGFTIARFGARKNIILGNIFAAIGLLCMSQAEKIWHVYLFFGVMGGLGIAFAEFLPLTTVINQWFIRRRSLALGLLFTSGGLGGFIFPLLISMLITNIGWRWTWIYLAFIHLLLGVVLAGLLIRSRPEEEGQVPDGQADADRPDSTETSAQNLVYSTKENWTLHDALQTPALWIILILFSVFLFSTMMLITHQVAYLLDMKYSATVSSSALGLMLGMSILGRIASGFLGMHVDGRYLAAVFMACQGLGIVSLINAGEIIFVYGYSIFTGIGIGGMIVLLPNVIGSYFGRTHFSQIVGWTIPVVTMVSAFSPMLAGFFYDSTGSYLLLFALTAAILLVCCILALIMHPPRLKSIEG